MLRPAALRRVATRAKDPKPAKVEISPASHPANDELLARDQQACYSRFRHLYFLRSLVCCGLRPLSRMPVTPL